MRVGGNVWTVRYLKTQKNFLRHFIPKQHNTEGINCEKCKKEYFRPANISHYRHDACRPCNCDLTGSENNVCIRDETEAFNDMVS